jgi:hypothetical protein
MSDFTPAGQARCKGTDAMELFIDTADTPATTRSGRRAVAAVLA